MIRSRWRASPIIGGDSGRRRLETATLVGNDSDGAIAQMAAAEHPERAALLVLNSCEMYDRFLPPQFRPLQMLSAIPGSLAVLGRMLRFRPAQRAGGYGLSMKHGMPEREVMDSYLRPGRESAGVRRDLRKFLRAVDSRYTLDAAEKRKAFNKPVLVAWAVDDKLFPLDHPAPSPRR